MLNSLIDTGVVVNGKDVAEGTSGCWIDEDDGNVIDSEAIEEKIFDTKGHDGDAVDFAFEHAAGTEFHGFGFVVGGADEDLVAVSYSDLFKLLNEFGKERVGDFRDNESEQFTFAGDESASLSVGEVVEFGDGLPDAGRKYGIDRGDVVDGAGYGRNRDTCACGNAANVYLGGSGGVSRLVRTFHGCGIT